MGVSTKGGSPSRNPFVPFELLNSKNHMLNNSMFDAPPTYVVGLHVNKSPLAKHVAQEQETSLN